MDKQNFRPAVDGAMIAAALVYAGVLWTRVEVLAADPVTDARVVKIEADAEYAKEKLDDAESEREDIRTEQKEQTRLLNELLRRTPPQP